MRELLQKALLAGYMLLEPRRDVLCPRCRALKAIGLEQWVCLKCGYTEDGWVL